MIIFCESFGSRWWPQNVVDEAGKLDRKRSKWFNTTGIPRGNSDHQWRQVWSHRGVIRVDLGRFPWLDKESDLFRQSFFTDRVEDNEGQTRILLKSISAPTVPIDAYLVCVKSDIYGFVDRMGQRDWKAKDVRLIAASGGKHRSQELLILAPEGGWILTDQGYWRLTVIAQTHRSGKPAYPIVTFEPTEDPSLAG